ERADPHQDPRRREPGAVALAGRRDAARPLPEGGGVVTVSAAEAKNLMRTIRGVAKLLVDVAQDGAASLTPARVRDLKGIARGLSRVKLRRLSNRLLEFARSVASLLRNEQGGFPQLAQLLTDCVNTSKLVKTHLET